MPNSRRIVLYALSFLFLSGIALIGSFIDRTDSLWLLTTYVSVFGVYLSIWRNEESKILYIVGVLARIVLLFSLPTLSDDLYRFLWDGHLLRNGINPFTELPSFYVDQKISGLSVGLYERLNSPNYFTIYPPINQGIFWLAVTISQNWLVAAGIIRLVLFAADLGTFHFLKKWLLNKGMNEKLAFLYFLNPLVILEGVGNLHFESLVVFFLMYLIYHVSTNHTYKSSIGFGLAIGTKLLPLIFLPYFFLKDIGRKNIGFTLITLLVTVLVLSPLYSEAFIMGMRTSLSLYFNNFEFNGSIFFLAYDILIPGC